MTGFARGTPGSLVVVLLAALAIAAPAAVGAGPRPGSMLFEDAREGFPKIAAYRPSCTMSAQQAARFDWVVTDGNCSHVLDAAHARNPRLLGMIQPTVGNSGLLLAASYGAYDHVNGPLSDVAIGTIRPFRAGDWLHDIDGAEHLYGTVNVLNLLSHDTAIWSADVAAYWARRNGALNPRRPGIMGIWGDNDLWSDQRYAFVGTVLESAAIGTGVEAANAVLWDTNYVARHQRLARDLPGMVIGGNDISSYSSDPRSFRAGTPNGWALPGISSAGMRECADKYFGLYDAVGVDRIIAAAQRFLAAKQLDGKQRYLMLNNCNADSVQVNEYSLAVATIAGMYYWPYTQAGFWASTLTIGPAIPGVARDGARHWLGLPIAAPHKLASGLWKRRFEHGTVYVNMTGADRVVDGRTLASQTGFFLRKAVLEKQK